MINIDFFNYPFTTDIAITLPHTAKYLYTTEHNHRLKADYTQSNFSFIYRLIPTSLNCYNFLLAIERKYYTT